MPSPSRRRVVLDTDTYNEVDDQFALAHLLFSEDQVALDAIYAAPFLNKRSNSPEDGMEKSHEEIFRVLDAVEPRVRPPVFKGSTRFMRDPQDVVESATVSDLVERAMNAAETLYVLAIGAPTNVASALIAEPRIAEKIVVVWLGGHSPQWPNANEFNLRQDIHASRILLEAKAPLVLLPCNPVASHLITTVSELETHLAPFSKLGAYLTKCVADYEGNPIGWSKQIWDIAVSAWAIHGPWVTTCRAPSPILRDDLTWDLSEMGRRPTIEIAYKLHRDPIFADFFRKAQLNEAR